MSISNANMLTRILRTLGVHSQPRPAADPLNTTQTVHGITAAPSPLTSTLPIIKERHPRIAIVPTPQLYSFQAKSPLFAKLPIELRDLIWELCVGGNDVHMFWRDRDTLLGFLCREQKKCVSIMHVENQGKVVRWDTANELKESDLNQFKGMMAILLVCKAMYFEAAKIMYSRNTFDFSDHWPNICYLQWNLPLSALCTISSVSITCHGVPLPSNIRKDFKDWQKMWDALVLLRNLHSLKIELILPKQDGSTTITKEAFRDKEDGLLEPALVMTSGKVWNAQKARSRERKIQELVLPFEPSVGGSVAGKLEAGGWKITRV